MELLIEGRIATLAGDRGFGWVEAIAIRDGEIIAAGSRPDVIAATKGGAERWRLGDDVVVMPSLTDAHLHLVTTAISDQQIDLTGLGLDDALARLAAAHAERARAGDRTGWLQGHGWSPHSLGSWPDAGMLQAVAPGRPVALTAHDHHSRWLSPAGLSAAGIRSSTADPAGGLIRRDADGRPTGILHEAAITLVDDAIPQPSEAELDAWITQAAARLAALGVTGCHDPGELTDREDLERGPALFRRLAERGRLPLRVHSSIRAPQLDAATAAGLRSGDGEGHYRMGWLKLFADGSLGSRSAALLEPYSDAAERPPTGGPTGMFTMAVDELRRLVMRAAQAGISSQIHAIGDAAVRAALDVLADAPPTPLMRRIEHAQLVDPADFARFGALDIAASVQPVHLRSDAEQAVMAWGERADSAFPLRALDEGGALIPFGTDSPVEPIDPWPGLTMAVHRADSLRPHYSRLGPRHAIGLDRAIRAACLDPVRSAGVRNLGRLTRGSRADLIVAPANVIDDQDDPRSLAAGRPLATMLDGDVIHAAAEFTA